MNKQGKRELNQRLQFKIYCFFIDFKGNQGYYRSEK